MTGFKGKKIVISITVFTVILFGFFAVSAFLPAHAQEDISCPIEGGEGGLVPCGRQCDDPTTPVDEAKECTFCHFFYLFDTLNGWLLFRMLPVLVLLFLALGGGLILTSRGNAAQLDMGKKMILWALVGYAIAFLGWMILNSFFAGAGLKKWTGVVGERGNFTSIEVPLSAPVTFQDTTKEWEDGEWEGLPIEINHPSWDGPQVRSVSASTEDSLTVDNALPGIAGPEGETTYNLGGWWQFSCGVTTRPVIVEPPPTEPPLPEVELSIIKNPISEDEFVDFTWTTSNVSICRASGAWSGSKSAVCSPTCSQTLAPSPPSGVCAPYDLDYILTCSGTGGSAESTVTVLVTEGDPSVRTPPDTGCESDELGPPIVMLLSTPETISEGDPSALVSYQVNADSCQLGGAPRNLCWPLCYDIVRPAPGGATYTYDFSCTNVNGTAADSASVAVETVTPPDSWAGVWEEQRFMRPGPRVGHATVVFTDPADGKEKIWLLGGITKDEDGNDVYKNDVWSYDGKSYDGEGWVLVGDAGWEERAYHTAVAYNGKIWMLGGGRTATGASCDPTCFSNEVWSFDGTTWTKHEDAPWAGRGGHASLVFKDPFDGVEKIWVMGGRDFDGVYREDIWVFDGTIWVVKGGAEWIHRAYHASVVFPDPLDGGKEKMWVMGGSQPIFLSDVWVSSNGITWERRDDAPWSGRMGHQAIVYQSKIWIIGGLSNDGFENDVWSFTGITWEAKGNADWLGRAEHRVEVFQDPLDGAPKIWMMGGSVTESDMWTYNGVNWVRRIDHRWSPRIGHTTVVFTDPVDAKEKMWVMGGVDEDGVYQNDVWISDGIIWEVRLPAAPWAPRADHVSVVYNGEMWVMGGSNAGGFLNDVWSSANGVIWTRHDPFEDSDFIFKHWEKRRGHAAVVSKDRADGVIKMWIMGGVSADGLSRNDVWYSTNGIDWTERIPGGAIWTERAFHDVVSQEDTMWVTGGFSEAGYENDVWPSQDGSIWSPDSPFSVARRGHETVSYIDPLDLIRKIWLLGGQDSPSTYRNDVSSSPIPLSWTGRGEADWIPRTQHTSVVFTDPRDGKEKIWILGGLSQGGVLRNDVWYGPRRY